MATSLADRTQRDCSRPFRNRVANLGASVLSDERDRSEVKCDSARLLRKCGVRIQDGFHPIHHHHRHPRGPVETLIRVHAHSLKLARLHRLCDHTSHHCPGRDCHVADVGQFRIILNAARREIEELRRQCGVHWKPLIEPPGVSPRFIDANPGAELANPPRHRKAYAMPPVDHGRSVARVESAPMRLAQQYLSYRAVTNLGTLMDVLG